MSSSLSDPQHRRPAVVSANDYRRAEKRWRELTAAHPEAVVIHIDGCIAYANDAAAELIGASSPDELIGMPSLGFVREDVRPHYAARLLSIDVAPARAYDEMPVVRLDGKTVWIRMQPVRMVYDGRDAIHMILVDVTAQRRDRIAFERRNRLITASAKIGAELLRVIEVDMVVDRVLEEVLTASGADCVALHCRLPDDSVTTTRLPAAGTGCPQLDAAYVLKRLASRQSIHGAPKEALFDLHPDQTSALEMIALTPIIVDDALAGALVLEFSQKAPGWSTEDMDALSVIGSALGHAIERERIETRRRLSERRYRRLIEQASDGIFVNADDGSFIDVNEAACRMTGYSAAELRKLTPGDVVTPESQDARPFDWHSLEVGEVRHVERTIRRKDGSRFVAEVSVTRNDDGLIQAILHDVSQRVAAETALRENRDRLALALESARMGIWDVDLASGRVTWTEETARLFGISLEDFSGEFDEVIDRLHPGDQARVRETFDRAARTARDFELTHRVRRPDGTILWVLTRGRAVDHDTSSPRMIGTIHDVTEPVRARRRLRRQTNQIRAMLAALPDLVVRVRQNDDGSVRLSSPRRQRSIATRAARDRHVPLPPLIREQYQRAFDRLIRRREAVSFSYDLQDDEGGSVVFEVRMARSGENEAVAVVRDVTLERRREMEIIQARDEAQEMSRLKSAFLANMSHEIRTPLTSIIGFSDILAEQIEGEATEFLSIIRTSGERLMQTLNSVLDLAQIESGTVELDVRPSDLMDRLRTAVEFFTPQAEVRRLELRFEVDPEAHLPARIDAAATDRILTHLFDNAIKFTPEGMITVRAWPEEDASVVQIADTGIGMSPEFLERMFEPFVQESSGIARDFEGTGLGLTIIRNLLDLMGGSLEAESRRGTGSVFTVRFPRAIRPVRRTGGPTPLPRTDGRRRRRVLVVDDDDATRALVEQVLEDEFEVMSVSTGEEAVAAVEARRPDALLLDVTLRGSGLTGEDVLFALRQRGYLDLPIIAVTARTFGGERERLLDAGFDGYVSKPFRKEHLISSLRMTHHAASAPADIEEDLDALLDLCRDQGLIDRFEKGEGHVIITQDIAHLKLPTERACAALRVMLQAA